MAVLTRLLAMAVAALGIAVAPPGVAQEGERLAVQRIQAAYLHHFCSFVEWPATAFAGPEAPLVIGIAGDDGLARMLRALTAQRTVQGRPIEVRRLRGDDIPPGRLHVLFVGRDAVLPLAQVAASLDGEPVLVVSDESGGVLRGSMIDFVIDDDRVRFDVALDPVARAELRISSRMLEVARRVLGAP